jgi:hypothetical protein
MIAFSAAEGRHHPAEPGHFRRTDEGEVGGIENSTNHFPLQPASEYFVTLL